MLEIRRERLIDYLAALDQTWREDSTNRDLRHTRNRVRHGILPRLERHVNPSVREVLAEAAEIARGEEEYWAGEVARVLPQVWNRIARGGALHCKRLADFEVALRRRVVRAAGGSLGLGLEFRQVEEVLALRGEGARTSLPEDWIASLRKGELWFEPASADTLEYEYALSVPGEVLVREAGVRVKAVRMDTPLEGYNPEHLLDWKHSGSGLIVRNWHAGERFWPAHTKEPKKIKELLQDRHVTGEEKKRWPVVACADEIVWVRGLGVRRDLLAQDGSGVLIQEECISDD
jgi:tRNA(Ile)-lysidine synthase